MKICGAEGRVYMDKNGEMVELGEVRDFKVISKSDKISGEVPANIPAVVSGSCTAGNIKLTKAFKKFFGIKILYHIEGQDKKSIESLMRRGKRRGRK